MPSLAVVKQYLTLTVLPVLAGAASTWLMVHVHFLAAFHATQSSVAGELTQLGTFGVGAGLAWLASHHILKGTYPTPAPTPVPPVAGK